MLKKNLKFILFSLVIKENKYKKMLRCSSCTAGSTAYSSIEGKKCNTCQILLGHICGYCKDRSHGGILRIDCYKCRPHICLSKCLSRCIKKEARVPPKCRCAAGPIRLQVKKDGPNHGKFFWSCRPCNFFEWD